MSIKESYVSDEDAHDLQVLREAMARDTGERFSLDDCLAILEELPSDIHRA